MTNKANIESDKRAFRAFTKHHGLIEGTDEHYLAFLAWWAALGYAKKQEGKK